jgi:hypothetical protein
MKLVVQNVYESKAVAMSINCRPVFSADVNMALRSLQELLISRNARRSDEHISKDKLLQLKLQHPFMHVMDPGN